MFPASQLSFGCLRKGFALVLVLAMLVLVSGIVTAFFSRALQERRVESASLAQVESSQLALSARAMILNDLVAEMEAGSEVLNGGESQATVFLPRLVEDLDTGYWVAPSMVAQRRGAEEIPGVVKVSRAGQPFFDGGLGYEGPAGPVRAANVSTAEPALDGPLIPRASWNMPRLIPSDAFLGTEEEAAAFIEPDWIYLTRNGRTPVEWDQESIRTAARSASDNEDYVIGRFAYVIYDTGGLMDLNLVGNALEEEENRRRGLLHQVDLGGGVGPVEAYPGFETLVAEWRSPNGSADEEALFDPSRDWRVVPAGEQILVSRGDLLRLGQENPLLVPEELLPYVTTFNRDLNAPSYQPDPDEDRRPRLPADPPPEELNPDLLTIRYTDETLIDRPDEKAFTVAAGTPVLFRRFPLSKLDLFNEDEPDAAAMEYYFGLERPDDGGGPANNRWEYTAHLGGRIARLHEVAAQGREPNFFEILQAVIVTGSLGRDAGPRPGPESRNQDRTFTLAYLADTPRNVQVMRIGANIIDQWDDDNVPTHILYPSGLEDVFVDILGVENLPYVYNKIILPYRPQYDRDQFQLWALFDVWNQHQNVHLSTPEISEYRIVPIRGSGRFLCSLMLRFPRSPVTTYLPTYQGLMGEDGARWTLSLDIGAGGSIDANQSITELNPNRYVQFPADQGYSEPTMVGGWEPQSEGDIEGSAPGLLLYHLTGEMLPYNEAIPPKSHRPPGVQQTINELYDHRLVDARVDRPDTDDHAFPYRATDAEGNVIREGADLRRPGDEGEGSGGERVYPPGTQIEIIHGGTHPPPPLDEYWAVSGMGVDGAPVVVYGKMGTKAHNYLRYYPKQSNDPLHNDPLAFELQGRIDGDWVTVQQIDDFWAWTSTWTSGADEIRGPHDNTMSRHTHHSEPSFDLETHHYPWQFQPYSHFYIDPRTKRFGLSGNIFRVTETSLRTVEEPWDGRTHRTTHLDYMLARGSRVAGTDPDIFDSYDGFPYLAPYGFVSNHPEVVDDEHPLRYQDRDGIIRPGDGYWGAKPTLPGNLEDRPLLLNRAFRSVGELGYVFRDSPWRTLDFASERSGDLGLLDVFSVGESPGYPAVTAGKINLNSAREEVLVPLLTGTARHPGLPDGTGADTPVLSEEDALAVAQAVVQEAAQRPFLHRGEIVQRVVGLMNGDNPVTGQRKHEREAAIRTLSELGSTRTWNFMIDLVVQTGRFTTASREAADFVVRGSERVWVHVAMDRITGEVVEMTMEKPRP